MSEKLAPIEGDRLPEIADALRTAAERYGTPLYLTDISALDRALDELAAAFPDPFVRQYSLKANPLPAIVSHLAEAGPGRELGANAVSLGEWHLAKRAGVPNERISLEGIGKGEAELRAAVRAALEGEPLLWLALESPEEAAALAEIALDAGLGGASSRRAGGNPEKIDVLLRFNPEVTPETEAGLAVGAQSSKFGMTEAELGEAIDAGGGPMGALRWRGLQLHVGSQLRAVDAWRDAIRRALPLLALMSGGLPEFDTLDLGGGFPLTDLRDPSPRPERFARELPALLDAVPTDRRPARLAIEPGRFLVARGGWIVARVLHVRDRRRSWPVEPEVQGTAAEIPDDEDRRSTPIVVIDAGMTELIRPALYGARHGIVALSAQGRRIHLPSFDGEPTRVEGPICESTDHLGTHVLPRLRRGDLVAIRDAGAYAASLSSTYNGRPRPPQVLLQQSGRLVLARRRGSLGSLA